MLGMYTPIVTGETLIVGIVIDNTMQLHEHRAKFRELSPGDKLLALLSIVGSPVPDKIYGSLLYRMLYRQVYITGYRKATQLCHVHVEVIPVVHLGQLRCV